MLFYPFLYAFILFYTLDLSKLMTPVKAKLIGTHMFKKKVFLKWFINYIAFKYFYYEPFTWAFDDFDSSGHVCCTLQAISCWFSILTYLYSIKEHLI